MSLNWDISGEGVQHLPTLYAKDSKGGVKEWTVGVKLSPDGMAASLVTTFGKKGGKLQEQERVITTGKNVGKTNETSPFQQAISEAESDFKKKQDKGYTPMGDIEETAVKLPMLAQDFHKRKHDILYPCAVQPKLNGVRAFGHVGSTVPGEFFSSRGGKTFAAGEHLIKDVKELYSESTITDGEIYNHDLSFQEIIRRVKKYRPGQSEELEYWIYDLADTAETFDTRDVSRYPARDGKLRKVGGIEVMVFGNVVLVPTFIANNEDSVKRYHDKFVEGGFEGAIVRNYQGAYVFNHRSKDLQKFKEFQDGEFEIVGGFEGTGTEDGCIVFEVQESKDSGTFKVRPRGSHDYRRDLMAKLPELLGKQLTVRFQERSEDGVPIFPVGIAIRDYE